MRPTRWADARLRFLDPIDTLPDAFKTVQSGNFDVKVGSFTACFKETSASALPRFRHPVLSSSGRALSGDRSASSDSVVMCIGTADASYTGVLPV